MKRLDDLVDDYFYQYMCRYNYWTHSKGYKTSDDPLKFLTAVVLLYFKARNKYKEFITWVTGYYPFSLLWRYSIYHSENKILLAIIRRTNNLMLRYSLKFTMMTSEHREQYYWLEGILFEMKENSEEKLECLRLSLEKQFQTVYLKLQKNVVTIIVPKNMER